MTLFGTSLASSIQTASTVPLSMTAADVSSVTIGGVPAAILFASPGQINVQVPWEALPGSAAVVVTNSAGTSQAVQVQVQEFAPVIMNLGFGASAQAFAINTDGTLNGITNSPASIPGVVSHPEIAGNGVTLYVTGLGPVTSTPADGAGSMDQTRFCMGTQIATVGGLPAPITSCVLSGPYAGVYQVTITVPFGLAPGDQPVQIQIADTGAAVPSTNLATIATH
jgi:uncharacterized protein (TIGR03437 family)